MNCTIYNNSMEFFLQIFNFLKSMSIVTRNLLKNGFNIASKYSANAI